MKQIYADIPCYIKIENKSKTKRIGFVLYGDNITAYLNPEYILEFRLNNSEQVLYYLNQDIEGLEFSIIEKLDATAEKLISIDILDLTGNVMEIKNTSDKDKELVIFKENYTELIKSGDSLEIGALSINEVIYYLLQDFEVTYTVVNAYAITYNLSHIVNSPYNATVIKSNSREILKFTPSVGYTLPSTVTVQNAEYTWNANDGILIISNPVDAVSIAITGIIRVFNITTNLIHCSGVAGNPTTITYGQTAQLEFTPDTNYLLPDTVIVNGATHRWVLLGE